MFFPTSSHILSFPRAKAVSGAALFVAGVGLLGGCGKWGQTPTVVVAAPAVKDRTSPPLKKKIRVAPKIGDAIPASAKGHVVLAVKTRQKVFALTFDDGPHPRYTRQVLDILKKNHIRATFFLIGSMVKTYPKVAHEVAAEGHVIGNHSWSHPSRPKNPVAEFQKTDVEIVHVLGRRPDLFRPPYGLLHNGLADTAKKRGDAVILWNSMGSDWSKKATVSSITSAVLSFARPGGIALLHDGGGNRSNTVAALPVIIETLRERGFRFVTIPQLLRISPPVNVPEKEFWKKNGLKLKNGEVKKVGVKPPAKPTKPA
jgi:peptidoglycan/xylan/chitin deacetylase (PgdA/CDA1 family)